VDVDARRLMWTSSGVSSDERRRVLQAPLAARCPCACDSHWDHERA